MKKQQKVNKEKPVEENVEKTDRKEAIKQFIHDVVKPTHMVVDFGSSSMKIVYGNYSKKGIEIYGHNIMPVTKDIVDDGKILNPLEVATMLKKSITENEVNVKGLTLILSGSDVIVREIQIPKVDEREVGKIIEFEAQQYFPIELSEYMTDFKILEEIETEEEDKLRVLLVAVPLEQIQDYLQVSEFLGIELDAIDLLINTSLKYLLGNNYLKELIVEDELSMDEMNLKRFFSLDMNNMKKVILNFIKEKKEALKNKIAEKKQQEGNVEEGQQEIKENNDEEKKQEVEGSESKPEEKVEEKVEEKPEEKSDENTEEKDKKKKKKEKKKKGDGKEMPKERNYALLDMGAQTTSIYIFSDYRLKFNRTLLVGGNELDKKIVQDLTITEKDAKDLKITKGSVALDEAQKDLYESVPGLNKAMETAFSNVLDDAGRFLEFYNTRSQNGNIEKIYIYGGSSKLRGAREFMTNFFNIPVEFLDRGFYEVDYMGKKQEDYELNKRNLINAIGGLIRS